MVEGTVRNRSQRRAPPHPIKIPQRKPLPTRSVPVIAPQPAKLPTLREETPYVEPPIPCPPLYPRHASRPAHLPRRTPTTGPTSRPQAPPAVYANPSMLKRDIPAHIYFLQAVSSRTEQRTAASSLPTRAPTATRARVPASEQSAGQTLSSRLINGVKGMFKASKTAPSDQTFGGTAWGRFKAHRAAKEHDMKKAAISNPSAPVRREEGPERHRNTSFGNFVRSGSVAVTQSFRSSASQRQSSSSEMSFCCVDARNNERPLPMLPKEREKDLLHQHMRSDALALPIIIEDVPGIACKDNVGAESTSPSKGSKDPKKKETTGMQRVNCQPLHTDERWRFMSNGQRLKEQSYQETPRKIEWNRTKMERFSSVPRKDVDIIQATRQQSPSSSETRRYKAIGEHFNSAPRRQVEIFRAPPQRSPEFPDRGLIGGEQQEREEEQRNTKHKRTDSESYSKYLDYINDFFWI
ncbi:MAG: hypothetical protein M1837_001847 [Sclerophora amabilis]|nr:MAG: hypothetical protein M1837_001847 [Sclerophora amabilis]